MIIEAEVLFYRESSHKVESQIASSGVASVSLLPLCNWVVFDEEFYCRPFHLSELKCRDKETDTNDW